MTKYQGILRSLSLAIDEAHVGMTDTCGAHLYQYIGRSQRFQPNRFDLDPAQLPECHRGADFADHGLDTRAELTRDSTWTPCSSMPGGPLRGVIN
ncbi:hypothetical protein D3C76_1686400 [compost metagenome]